MNKSLFNGPLKSKGEKKSFNFMKQKRSQFKKSATCKFHCFILFLFVWCLCPADSLYSLFFFLFIRSEWKQKMKTFMLRYGYNSFNVWPMGLTLCTGLPVWYVKLCLNCKLQRYNLWTYVRFVHWKHWFYMRESIILMHATFCIRSMSYLCT